MRETAEDTTQEQAFNHDVLKKKKGFPRGSDSKQSSCNEGDLGSTPGLGRSSGGWHGNRLQYSCPENPLAGYSAAAAAASKSLQSCPTLCDPRDGSPPGSPVPGVLQARTLEWVAISFSNTTLLYYLAAAAAKSLQSCLTL